MSYQLEGEDYKKLPEHVLPLMEDTRYEKGEKQVYKIWSNYGLILNDPKVTQDKIKGWI